MIELKLKCYSCNYERIIGEREYIEDLQQCPKCDSDNIEILEFQTEDLTDSYLIHRYLPSEREQIISASELTKMRYCKRCNAEVKPIKTPKTIGKRIVNVITVSTLGAGFSYPYRCPNCGKVLRTRGQLNTWIIIIFVVIIFVWLAIIFVK
jgi:predicted RNA-binding Zn-ribbon protein involved in translation (DUF1610 family)